MERGRPNNESEDTRTVPIFGISDSQPLAPDGEERRSDATQTRSAVSERTSQAEDRADLPSNLGPGAILLGKYKVIKKIGEGGMGNIWLVQHLGLDEPRALKVISEGIAGDPTIRARFKQEAKILAKLKHPNAVTVHDTGIVGDTAYIEMEFIQGASLRQYLKGGEPLSPSFILWVMRGICEVLSLAHNRGIVHRDLKPDNVMVVTDPETGDRSVKVLDFGIAKIIHNAGDSPVATMHTENILGTVAYASPEQNAVELEGGRRATIDHRSDLYSLGVMLYELITGRRPFKGSVAQLLYQHAKVDPVAPSEVAPEVHVPPAVESLVLRCLAKTADPRPGSASELYNALRAAYGDVPSVEDGSATGASHARKSALPLLTPHSRIAVDPEVEAETEVETAGGTRSKTKTKTKVKTKPDDTGRRWTFRRVFIGLALGVGCLTAAWLYWHRDPTNTTVVPPPPPPTGVSPEVAKYLQFHYGRRIYEPMPEAETVELDGMRWPVWIVRTDAPETKLRLHDRIYLPEGSRPETSAGPQGALGLPRLVINEVLNRPIPFRLIDGGTFKMGDDDPMIQGGGGSPGHEVSLSTYYIQEHETTIGEIDAYCTLTGRSANGMDLDKYREAKQDLDMPAGANLDKFPAVALSRKFCEAYARDLGGELPTEAQWEFAASSRGDRKTYVWEGDDSAQGKANISNLEPRDVRTLPFGSFSKDQTKQGVFDLAGNAREWCRDMWKDYREVSLVSDPLETPLPSEDADPNYVIRGGSYDTPKEMARVTHRSSTPAVEYKAKNTDRLEDVGFRVVLEVVIAQPLSSEPPTPGKKDAVE